MNLLVVIVVAILLAVMGRYRYNIQIITNGIYFIIVTFQINTLINTNFKHHDLLLYL
jgi:hypothetical protein